MCCHTDFLSSSGYLNLNAACAINFEHTNVFHLCACSNELHYLKASYYHDFYYESQTDSTSAAKFFGMLCVVLLLVISLAPHVWLLHFGMGGHSCYPR